MIVLIPAYEPAERLPELVVELRGDAPELTVLVVDDGSGSAFDGVFDRAARAGAEVLRHPSNRGKGVALKSGFRHVIDHHPGQGVVTADADGQHTVADIIAVAAEVRDAPCSAGSGAGTGANAEAGAEARDRTMVLGCRAFDGDVPLRSRLGNTVARRLFRIAAGWKVSDTQTGLRGIPAAMLPWILTVEGDRFEYEQRVLLHLRAGGFRARERRIETVYLAGNGSSHFRPVIDSVRVMLPVAAFAASSLLGFVVDTVALFALTALTGALVPSIIAARILSASTNFWVNRRVVFMRRGRTRLGRQIAGYLALAALLLASNIVWMSYLTGLGVPLWIAKVITELVLFATSYRVQRGAVFAIGTSPGPAAPVDTAPTQPAPTQHPAVR